MRFFRSSARVMPLGGGSCSIQNQTSICCLSPAGLSQKIEFVISCQSQNISEGASGAYAPSLSRLHGETWQAARRRNPPVFPPRLLRGAAAFVLYHQELFLAAIHRDQVSHHLPG